MKILDLHGLRHHDATHACHLFINDNWGDELKIITGNSSRMKNLVCDILIYYNLKYTLDNPYDMGYIIVRK